MELIAELVKDILLDIDSKNGVSMCFPVDVNPEIKATYDKYTIMKNLQLCRMNDYIVVSFESNEGIFIDGLTDEGKKYLEEVKNK